MVSKTLTLFAMGLSLALIGPAGAQPANPKAVPAKPTARTTASGLATAPTPAATPTPAVTPHPLKIGFIDMDTVFQQSKAVQEQVGRVQDQLDAKKKEIDRKTSEYNRLRDSLQRQDTLLTDQEKTNRRKRIEQLKSEIEDLQFEADKHLRDSQSKVIDPVLDAVMKTVQEIGKKEGYDLILRGELVLYGGPGTDLTDRVIRELDSKALIIPGLAGEQGGSTSSSDLGTTSSATSTPSPGEPRQRHPLRESEPLPLVP